MKNTIGLMMVLRNERGRIKRCLNWHVPFVDEVAICDQESDDGTWEILKEYKKSVEKPFYLIRDKKWGFCEPSKQKTADLLKTDWVLYLDADEKFPKKFLKRMHKIVEENDHYGYTFPRNNIFRVKVFSNNVPIVPKWLKVQHPSRDYQLRLTRRDLSCFPPHLHHRVRIKSEKRNIGKMIYAIDHLKTLSEQWEDNQRYRIINKKK
jgi:glycosyltransferase involved in cell wall biosynthesis